MLADVLVCGAVGAVIVGGQFGKEGEHDAFPSLRKMTIVFICLPSAKPMYRKTIDEYEKPQSGLFSLWTEPPRLNRRAKKFPNGFHDATDTQIETSLMLRKCKPRRS